MCGIVGILNRDRRQVSGGLLTRMRDAMYFRGPDDAGIWTDNFVGFGHRRLSIIDLSSLGHQPMIDELTGAVIVYNGEIYNFLEIKKELEKSGIQFISKSDSEVVLKAYRKWGGSCVDKFIGMFAFAIWDPGLNGIFLARDRLGVKPLFYYVDDKTFIFASRLTPFMLHPACPDNVDLEAVGLYLEMGFVPAPWSILKGIKKLRPGCTLWVDNKTLNEKSYWSLDSIRIDNSLIKESESSIIYRLDSLLNDSIKLRLVSDVPLGAFLSGGIDSSLIVAVMQRHLSSPVKTFTIGFKEKGYNEASHAGKIAKYLGTDHLERIMEYNDLLDLINDNSKYYDEPLADSSSLPTIIVSRLAREHVKVSLSGDGGDELFCGYPYYSLLAYLKPFYNSPFFVRFLTGKLLSLLRNHRAVSLGNCFLQKGLGESFLFMRSLVKDYSRIDSLMGKNNTFDMSLLFEGRRKQFLCSDEVSFAGRLDAAYYLPDDILQKVDVASMSISLEARGPFLDHRIAEFALSLPIKYKLRFGQNKWILKKLLGKYLPEKLFMRPKQGFIVPIDRWFRHELRDVICDELSPERIKKIGYLDPKEVIKIRDLHLSGRRNTHPILWAMLNLLRWQDYFNYQRKEALTE